MRLKRPRLETQSVYSRVVEVLHLWRFSVSVVQSEQHKSARFGLDLIQVGLIIVRSSGKHGGDETITNSPISA